MITLQDRIEVPAHALAQLRALVHQSYLPGALARAMTLGDESVSPPLRLTHGDATLWLRWTLPDLGAWWAMRVAAGDPAVAAFWTQIDAIASARERVVLTGDERLPQPDEVSGYTTTPAGWRETAQLYLHDGIGDKARAELEAVLRHAEDELDGLVASSLAVNLTADYGGGHYTWDLLYRDRDEARRAQQGRWWRDVLLPALDRHCRARSALGLETLGAGARDPELAGGVKRTALFRLLPGVDAEVRARFERDLLDMPAYITAIRNWRLSRAVTLAWDMSDVAPWSYVWEQEFAELDGLNGAYMAHPHHWAHVDRWFDPESGVQIIDTALCHAFSPLVCAIITR
ncbi:MAG: Dabb family protein [Pseudomonadales bacterium]|jgi:hypothetical protein|nr:Dabb family protein [Pseudomonadales bacterium]MCP5321706.1 Dabb family protein [Pseudomonadales bacterium]